MDLKVYGGNTAVSMVKGHVEIKGKMHVNKY